jgi:predicted metalloprotease
MTHNNRVSVTGGDYYRPTVRSTQRLILLIVTISLTLLTGCSQVVRGEAVAAGSEVAVPAVERQPQSLPRGRVDPDSATFLSPVVGGTDSANDRFAARVATGVEQYWREEFPNQFGMPWQPLRGFVAADPGESANPPPCLSRSLDMTNQALYCPRLDTVAWDRTHLVPELRANYGDSAVIMALAHEIGHAVQARLGIDVAAQQREPQRYPTILLEGIADCLSGVTLHAVAQGRIAGLHTDPVDIDRALHGLLSFRDPVGRGTSHGAHGNGFDRASAFIGGFDDGAAACARMTVDDTTFTERPYRTVADASRGGNLSLNVLLGHLEPDVRGWFGRLSTTHGRERTDVRLLAGARCTVTGLNVPGAARLCPDSPVSGSYRTELAGAYQRYGDYAGGTVLVSRYALATLAALDRPVTGPEAGRTAVCLTGAYTGSLFAHGSDFELSPGDLDEAVDELLGQDLVAQDADGHAPAGDLGFDRIRQFRTGMLSGATGCGV